MVISQSTPLPFDSSKINRAGVKEYAQVLAIFAQRTFCICGASRLASSSGDVRKDEAGAIASLIPARITAAQAILKRSSAEPN